MANHRTGLRPHFDRVGLDRIGLDIFPVIIIIINVHINVHNGLPMGPEGRAYGTTQRGGSQETARQGNVDDDVFWVLLVLEELRARRIVCPPLTAIERLCGMVRARAQRQLWRRLTDGLTDRQRQALDQLLEVRSGGGQSTLAWLRQTAYTATTGNFSKLIERLNQVRALGIEPERATRVHQNYWLKLAREGGQCTVQHLAELEPLRRHATLTALALDLTATLTDEAFNMFEHLIGKLFKKSERAHTEQFHASGKPSTRRYGSTFGSAKR